jgi:membrane-associated phospholipid phosphatase
MPPADPMHVRAHIVGRAALASPRMEATSPWEPAAGPFLRVPAPTPGASDNLARWSTPVRAASIQQALLSGFHVEFDAPSETAWGCHIDKGSAVHSIDGGLRAVNVFSLQKPSEADFVAQLALVFEAVEQRRDRFEEVLAQAEFPWPLWAAAVNLQPGRHRFTVELLGHALGFTAAVYHRVKHEFACVRPADRSHLVQPLVPTPEHGALPSGHATESFLMAGLLPALLSQAPNGPLATYLARLADQIAHNRVVAGVHFPVDSQAGRALGVALARYLARRAGQQAEGGVRWSGRGVLRRPFDREQSLDSLPQGTGRIAVEPLWAWLWSRAAAEFAQ